MSNSDRYSLEETCEILGESYSSTIALCDAFEEFLSIKNDIFETRLSVEDIKTLELIRYNMNHKGMNIREIKSMLKQRHNSEFHCDFISQIILNEIDNDIVTKANNLYSSNENIRNVEEERLYVEKRDERFVRFVQQYRAENRIKKSENNNDIGLMKKLKRILRQSC